MRGESNNQAGLKGIETYLPSYLKPTPKEIKKPIPIKRKTLLNKPSSRSFAYGNCTAYVASKKSITWSGNAGTWLDSAKAQKYHTGAKPKVGAVLVESIGYYGHCSIVVQVSMNKVNIKIQEMNYLGLGVVSTRWLPVNNWSIKGYIY